MDLPQWVPLDAWEGFCEMRQRMRKPLTERAKKLAIRRLDQLRRKGYEPGMILDQSTFMGWQGLWPLKGDWDGDGATRKTFDAIRRESSVKAIRRTVEAYNQVGGDVHGTPPQGNKRIRDGGIH